MPGKIFVNYRRDDVPGDARGVRDGLAAKFGKANVFMDVDNLLVGQRFDVELAKALDACDMLIAVIGPRWMDLLKERTATAERDYVREEIAAALARKITVIPVRVGREGSMSALPRRDELPEDIRDLVLHQKIDVAHERFGRDMAELIDGIVAVRKAFASGQRPGRSTAVPWSWVGAGALAVLAIAYVGAAQLGVPVPWPTGAATRATDDASRAAEAARVRTAAERLAEAEAKLAAEQNARADAEARAKQLADAADKARRDQEAREKAARDEAARKKAEDEARARAAAEAEAKRQAEEDAKSRAAAAEARRRADAEAARKKAEDEARASAAAEAEAKRQAEEEAKARAAAAEARRRADAEAARKKAEDEARVRAAAEAEVKRKAEEEAKARAAAAEARRRADAEATRTKAEDEARARAAAEAEVKRKAEEAAGQIIVPEQKGPITKIYGDEKQYETIYHLSITADGAKIFFGNDAAHMKLWDAAERNRIRNFRLLSRRLVGDSISRPKVRTTAFSPNGKLALTGDHDGIVSIFDTDVGVEIQSIRTQTEKPGELPWVLAASFSPDGTQIAAMGSNGVPGLWDVSTGRSTKIFSGQKHQRQVWGLAFSDDGMLIASVDRRNVKIWDVEKGLLLQTLPLWGAEWVRFWPIGKPQPQIPRNSKVVVMKAAGNRTIIVAADEAGAALSASAMRLVTPDLRVIDLKTGAVIAQAPRMQYSPYSIAISQDGARIAVSMIGESDGVLVWDVPARARN